MPDGADVAALTEWINAFAADVAANKELLTRLDSEIGDADHGTNLDRGLKAALIAIADAAPDTVGALFKKLGMTLISKVGGASGPLYGTFFLRFGAVAGEVDSLDTAAFGASLRAGVDGVVARGKAVLEDKTMYDALAPAVDAYDAAGADFAAALRAAADAAAVGRDATTPLVARKGRASYLGERSAGHQDPGATSASMLLAAAVRTLG